MEDDLNICHNLAAGMHMLQRSTVPEYSNAGSLKTFGIFKILFSLFVRVHSIHLQEYAHVHNTS